LFFTCKNFYENAVLRAEVNDLKQQVDLENSLKEDDTEIFANEQVKRRNPEEQKVPNNPQCESASKSKRNEMLKTRGKEYNCYECDYQGSNQTGNTDGSIKCRNCGELFTSKWNLMNHRKCEHMNNVAYCRNYLQGKCDFADNICWWNHAEKVVSSEDQIHCFICNKVFTSKPLMMTHRKKHHPDIIRPCTQYQNNECRFLNESCWFKHEKESQDRSVPNTRPKEDDKMETESDFQKASKNLEPPLQSNQKPEKN
jgi:hypothetical protein